MNKTTDTEKTQEIPRAFMEAVTDALRTESDAILAGKPQSDSIDLLDDMLGTGPIIYLHAQLRAFSETLASDPLPEDEVSEFNMVVTIVDELMKRRGITTK